MPGIKDLCAVYWKEALNLKRNQPKHFHGMELLRYLPRWIQSVDGRTGPLDDELPWITFPAIQFLKKTLRPKMRVFEYGSGGSTLFFSRRVREIFSVEHDPVWHEKVAQRIEDQQRKNCTFDLHAPSHDPLTSGRDASDPEAYVSSDERFREQSFKTYATSIDSHASKTFDVVLVDGRARPSCVKHGLDKLKTGGYLIVDNAERPEYQRSYQMLANTQWARQDFFGPGPYNPYFWQTTFWKRVR